MGEKAWFIDQNDEISLLLWNMKPAKMCIIYVLCITFYGVTQQHIWNINIR